MPQNLYLSPFYQSHEVSNYRRAHANVPAKKMLLRSTIHRLSRLLAALSQSSEYFARRSLSRKRIGFISIPNSGKIQTPRLDRITGAHAVSVDAVCASRFCGSNVTQLKSFLICRVSASKWSANPITSSSYGANVVRRFCRLNSGYRLLRIREKQWCFSDRPASAANNPRYSVTTRPCYQRHARRERSEWPPAGCNPGSPWTADSLRFGNRLRRTCGCGSILRLSA